MKKLELSHLTPYLPHAVQLQSEDKSDTTVLNGKMLTEKYWYRYFEVSKYRPILQPISNLKGLSGLPSAIDDFINGKGDAKKVTNLPYWAVTALCAELFDVFGLIDAGLAIDVNNL